MNNLASLENRGNGSWRVIISNGYGPDGKKKRIQRTVIVDPTKTELSQRREVEKQAALIEADFQRQLITDAKKITFKAVYDDYIQDRIIRRGLAERTVDSYKKLFTLKLLPNFGKMAIREITARDLNDFFRKLKKEGRSEKKSSGSSPEEGQKNKKKDKKELSGTYCRKYYQQLNELFRYAQRTGLIVTNPCTLIEPPKIDTEEAQYYDVSECPDILEKIQAYQDPEWKCYFLMQFYCGSRPEEMTGLNWSDYDGKTIKISAGAYQAKGEKCKRTEKPKTKKSNRKIQLPPDAVKAMNAWKKIQAEKRLRIGEAWANPDAVFTNDLGERISLTMPAKFWKRFTAENGIRPLPLYCLRHTNASLLISSNELSVEEVAARMGHEQTSTTLNIYTHAFQKANEKATNALLNVLDSAKKKAE